MRDRREGVGYRDLAAILRARIVAGTLPPGARMPSETDLTQAYGVSRHTVRRAVALLREEGLVEVRHGHLTRVAEEPERTEVLIELGSTWIVRKATEAERDDLGLPIGGTVVQVATVDGATVVFASDRYIFRSV